MSGGRFVERTRRTGRMRCAPAPRRMVSAAFVGPAAGFAVFQTGVELSEPTCAGGACTLTLSGAPAWGASRGF